MNTRRSRTYQETIKREFAFLKATATLEDLFTKGLHLPAGGGMALPLATLFADDASLPAEIAAWNADAGSPLSAPVAQPDEAKAWLSSLLAAEDQLGFLVLDKHGRRTGILAFTSRLGEALDLELGVVAGHGELAEAAGVVCRWAANTLWPERVIVRAGASNEFFAGAGFVDERGVLEFRPAAGKVGQTIILTAGPSISAREATYAHQATKYGWNHQWNRYLSAFEKQFAEYIGVPHAIATSSCTGALHIALAALGIGPGDEVIVPDITWVATANAVLYVGATPVFADIDLDSWCLDPAAFEAKITPRTKAVMPVHLYGHPCDMDPILALARRRGLFVVEDAAPSIGAEYKGRRTGSFGDFACFSFQGAKLAVTGEGGMLLASDPKLYEKAYSIWDQGRKPGTFWIQSNGVKYKMANPLAALGLGQLERNDAMVEAKRRVFSWYAEGLAGVPHVVLNQEQPWARSIYWMSSLRLDEAAPVTRDGLRAALKQRNVDTRSVFPAISQYPIWPLKQSPAPVARRVGDQAINLPSGVCLSRDEVDYVCQCLREILTGKAA